MRYYVLPDKDGYRIMKVLAEDIPLFQKRYATEIVCEADSLDEVLLQFAAYIEKPAATSG
jgi:hypothetical protein